MRIWSLARSLACLGVGVLLTASLSRGAPLDPEQLAGEGIVEATATPEQIAFFEKSIRPVLVKECYSCHATTAENSRNTDTISPKANQKPYQVTVAPLKSKWTDFIAENTASAPGPNLFSESMPPAVCPAQKKTRR